MSSLHYNGLISGLYKPTLFNNIFWSGIKKQIYLQVNFKHLILFHFKINVQTSKLSQGKKATIKINLKTSCNVTSKLNVTSISSLGRQTLLNWKLLKNGRLIFHYYYSLTTASRLDFDNILKTFCFWTF